GRGRAVRPGAGAAGGRPPGRRGRDGGSSGPAGHSSAPAGAAAVTRGRPGGDDGGGAVPRRHRPVQPSGETLAAHSRPNSATIAVPHGTPRLRKTAAIPGNTLLPQAALSLLDHRLALQLDRDGPLLVRAAEPREFNRTLRSDPLHVLVGAQRSRGSPGSR